MIKVKLVGGLLVALALIVSQASFGSVLENSFWGAASKAAGVSAYDLYGIALQETKMKWSDGTVRPWPWTLVVNGKKTKVHRFKNRSELGNAVRKYLSMGIENIDIGLMQVNWKYNGKFYVKNPDDLTNPLTNVIVATYILKKNIIETSNKYHGIGHYHSRTPAKSGKYSAKVKAYSERLAYASKK